MCGPLRFNQYNVRQNPAAGSHDPSMMFDPITRRYYSYATDTHGGSIGTEDYVGIPIRSSQDLVHFTYHGNALSDAAIKQGRNNGRFPETRNFWAPFCEYTHGEYRLYYSATRAFGSSESRIWLAVASSPLGPFENRGVVADTWGTDNTYPNAIDPHIVWDRQRCYLVYGSFFGGIYIKELAPETGLPMDGDPKNLGKCIARKAPKPIFDGPEGAAVIYEPEGSWFYLFLSYAWLGDTYDIRVGRSRSVLGPYVDRQGRDLVEAAMGEKLAGSYRFTASHPCAGTDDPGWEWGGMRGPGHGVPFFDPVRQRYFFVHHVRDGAKVNETRDPFEDRVSFIRHYMMIRPMFFLDGWPVLGPEPFGGEDLSPVSAQEAAGKWELIFFSHADNSQKVSCFRQLSADDPLLTGGYLYLSHDFENQGQCLALTGVDEAGNAYWGKRVSHE